MKIFLLFLLMITCTVLANLLMKIGASNMPGGYSGFLAKLFSWYVMLGLAFFAFSAMIYLLILSWIPLSVAQSFAAAQFVAVLLSAYFFLGESISFYQFIGMIFIAIGITIVGWMK